MSEHHTGHGLRTLVLLVIVAVGGIAAGVYWHEQLEHLIGGHEAVGDMAGKQLWTCSMHPQVIRDKSGLCPICHMQLTPLNVKSAGTPSASPGMATPAIAPTMNAPAAAPPPGTILIDASVVQNMGVRLVAVTEAPLRKTVRVVGYFDEAEPLIRDINLRISGWVEQLYANTDGMHVEEGDPLFDIFSPELQQAIEELISGRKAMATLNNDADEISRRSAESLYQATAHKLELWGLPAKQVETLAKLDHAPRSVTFVSPIMGHVQDKVIVEGSAVKVGDRIMRIINHHTLWLDAQVFEQDLPLVSIGMKAAAMVAAVPGRTFEGKVVFIHPHMDMTTRTAMVRLAIPNGDLTLKPGMYGTVTLTAEMSPKAVMVPREAVIDSGEKQLAFVSHDGGHFEPRRVTVGLSGDDGMVQVLDGLKPGEMVVTSGQFLLDSESRLKEAVQKFLQTQQATAAPAAAVPAEWKKAVDDFVGAYLKVAAALGEEQKPGTSLDLKPLAETAHRLHTTLEPSEHRAAAESIAKSVDAMGAQPADKQRQTFKAVSDATVKLVEKLPPSAAVGDKLFVVYCSMAPGSWLQKTPDVANPFYATTMKECGEVVKTIPTSSAPTSGGGGGKP